MNTVIIDYGMSNIRSVHNKFKRMGVSCSISSEKGDIKKAHKLILPGVGNFKDAMQNLNDLDLIEVLYNKVIREKTPILGICLGAQLFCNFSEEGNIKGLGWINANVVKFKIKDILRYKVPHMGWNNIQVINSNTLDRSILTEDQFYFIHSYHIKSNNNKNIWMTAKYESEFVSAINKENIYGTQFHPEKSHDAGFKILKAFAGL